MLSLEEVESHFTIVFSVHQNQGCGKRENRRASELDGTQTDSTRFDIYHRRNERSHFEERSD